MESKGIPPDAVTSKTFKKAGLLDWGREGTEETLVIKFFNEHAIMYRDNFGSTDSGLQR